MLPYTPLHHLLLGATGRPLVMTSGNRHGEPIAYREDDARARLSPLVDAFLDHDREIIAPCDDSVVRVIGGAPTVLRRSRGYVPLPLTLPAAVPEPVLACGAQLANTFCLARDDRAWPSQHMGDLESPEAVDELARAVERMERWLGTRADVVAHDLHPGYASTRFALEREARLHVPVQHHHAHVASAMAEHHLEGPVLGVVFDGTGLGTDGALWGGEVLLVRDAGFERLATLRPILLAGGEAAIRDVWRLGLAVLDDAFDGAPPLEALPLFRDLVPADVAAVRGLLQRRLRCVPAHGAGRWFDALGALVLDRPRARHQGDIATLWNAVADETECRPYPFELGEPSSLAETAAAVPGGRSPHAPRLEIDLRPMVRAAVEDRLVERPAAEIAGRFHATLASAVAATLAALRTAAGNVPVVLSGGCFQNALLAERVTAALEPAWRVVRHQRVPPGDGGLALGQALVAGAVLRADGVENRAGGEKTCVSAFPDE
jgi:hydrogenase maturation protein HypF